MSLKTLRQPRGTLWECGVLGGEHRLYNHKNNLNWGALPHPPFLGGGFAPYPPFPNNHFSKLINFTNLVQTQQQICIVWTRLERSG